MQAHLQFADNTFVHLLPSDCSFSVVRWLYSILLKGFLDRFGIFIFPRFSRFPRTRNREERVYEPEPASWRKWSRRSSSKETLTSGRNEFTFVEDDKQDLAPQARSIRGHELLGNFRRLGFLVSRCRSQRLRVTCIKNGPWFV